MSDENGIDKAVITLLGCVGIIFILPIMLVFGSIVNGFVLVSLWDWFVIPLFESAPELTIPYAIGLCMIVSYLTYHYVSIEEKDYDSVSEILLAGFVRITVRGGLALLFGWIVAQFV